jgi:hypothetical protein
MPNETFTVEQIVGKLRQIEVLMGQGKTLSQAAKEAGMRQLGLTSSRRNAGPFAR